MWSRRISFARVARYHWNGDLVKRGTPADRSVSARWWSWSRPRCYSSCETSAVGCKLCWRITITFSASLRERCNLGFPEPLTGRREGRRMLAHLWGKWSLAGFTKTILMGVPLSKSTATSSTEFPLSFVVLRYKVLYTYLSQMCT